MKSSFPGKMERSLGSPMLTKLREIFSPERFFGDSIERNWSAIIAEAWSPAEKHTDVESLSQGAPVEETQSSQPWTVALNSLWDMRSPSKRHHEEVDDEDPIEMNSARSAHEADCLVVNFDRSSTCSALDAQLCSPAKRRDQRTRALSPGFGIDGEFSMHESGLHLSSSSHSAIMLPALDRFWEEYSPKSPGAPHESHQSDGEGDEVYEGESHIDQSVGSKKCFTDEQYWQMRSTRSEIATALSEGCGCRERCSDKLLNFDIVEAERHKMARVGSMERRSIVRADLAGFMVLDDVRVLISEVFCHIPHFVLITSYVPHHRTQEKQFSNTEQEKDTDAVVEHTCYSRALLRAFFIDIRLACKLVLWAMLLWAELVTPACHQNLEYLMIPSPQEY